MKGGLGVRWFATFLLFGVASCGSSSSESQRDASDAVGSDSGNSLDASSGDGVASDSAPGDSSVVDASVSEGSLADSSVADSASSTDSSDGGSSNDASSTGSSEASTDAPVGVDSGPSSDGADGGASAEAGSASPFTCNLVIGESPTGQWFESGFLQAVDASRWECIWIAHHYTNLWASPTDPGWTTAFDPYPGPAHACANGSATPDRVVFVAAQWSETTAAEWETDLTAIVQNIQTKYKGVKRVELMALTGAPTGMPCPFSGTGTNETIIPQVGYDAIDAMPAKFPGLVFALPHFDVPQCSDFVFSGGETMPQYTDAGAVDVAANLFGPYYAAHP